MTNAPWDDFGAPPHPVSLGEAGVEGGGGAKNVAG